MYCKLLIVVMISISTFGFSEKKLFKELKSVNLPLLTEAPLRYMVPMTYWHQSFGFKIPLIEFYKNKELKGDPPLKFKKDGLYKDNKLVCRIGGKEFDKINTLRNANIVIDNCKYNPFVYDYRDINSRRLLLLHAIDKKSRVAKIKINKEFYFFNLDYLEEYTIDPPTHELLAELLSQNDIFQIKSLLLPLRESLLKKDLISFKKQLSFYSSLPTGGQMYSSEIEKLSKKYNFLSGKYYKALLSATYLELLHYYLAGEIKKNFSNYKSFCMGSFSDDVTICFRKKEGKWFLTKYYLYNLFY